MSGSSNGVIVASTAMSFFTAAYKSATNIFDDKASIQQKIVYPCGKDNGLQPKNSEAYSHGFL